MTRRSIDRVRFAYLYRDAGNYKQHGAVVLANEEGLDPVQAGARLHAACEGDGNFNAAQVGLPELFFDGDVTDDDHSWHEFVSLEVTQDAATDPRSLSQLVAAFELVGREGWRIDEGRLSWDSLT